MNNQLSTETNKGFVEELNGKKSKTESQISTLTKIEELLNVYSSREIIFSPPLITRSGFPIIKRKTVNMIQGKYGTHKSRLAELLSALMISKNSSDNFLGFERDFNQDVTVVYLDSERNYEEEFASTIQLIRRKAGFESNRKIENFRYSSVRTIKRKERLIQIQSYLGKIQKETKKPIFAVLDVGTDFIQDFNHVEESMEFFDYLGNFTEDFDATFLVVIHENPSGGKARGNIGSEGANKSSTVMRIGFERINSIEKSELISLKFLKLRCGKKPEDIFLQFSEEKKGLVVADNSIIEALRFKKDNQSNLELLAEKLGEIFEESKISQSELFIELDKFFKISDGTKRKRIEAIEEQKIKILNSEEQFCYLISEKSNGSATYYRLIEIDADENLELGEIE